MNKKLLFLSVLFLTVSVSYAKTKIYDMTAFGIRPDSEENVSPLVAEALETIRKECRKGGRTVIRFAPGRYDFHEEGAAAREYYISNHDQDTPKKVGIALENMHDIILDGKGACFVFHGRMLPLSLTGSDNCLLRNFSIDFENPHISQITIVENDTEKGITFEVAPWVNYRINGKGFFEVYGENWDAIPNTGIAFEGTTRHLVYNTSDLFYSTENIRETDTRTLNCPAWKDKRLVPGTVVAMRTWHRPAPGIFVSHCNNTTFENIRVHYAEGMGLLAQLCRNITLNGFGVCLKGENDRRYFTTQADATHFSGCKGKIVSKNGLYENMMDDAINIHGTYLKIIRRIDEKTLVGRYMHDQSWGFEWGRPGDNVQFVRSATMEITGTRNRIASIRPYDKNETRGAREFLITFDKPVDEIIDEKQGFGIENLEWTPKVIFEGNIIRNNRARGTLFSTPKRTVVKKNLFDHTSGTAILLCGDCNGWYETGACRKVVIRDNKFINALTNMFQFTNAVISIYPEIPDLENQQAYFHGGRRKAIVIENNLFETFDRPILYAKSTDGLSFRKNTIRDNSDYPAFHWNRKRFLLERTGRVKIDKNHFEDGFIYDQDVEKK